MRSRRRPVRACGARVRRRRARARRRERACAPRRERAWPLFSPAVLVPLDLFAMRRRRAIVMPPAAPRLRGWRVRERGARRAPLSRHGARDGARERRTADRDDADPDEGLPPTVPRERELAREVVEPLLG